jgi:hypothetical protein
MGTTNRLVFAALLLITTAHRVRAAPDCAPPPPSLVEAPPCCPCACDWAGLKEQERIARETLAVGLSIFVPAYIAGTAFAFSLPGSVRSVDSLPIVGALAAGVRDRRRDNHSALLFSGGVQIIGAFMAALAAVELADIHERRWQIDVAVGNGTAGLSAQLRF